MRRPWGEVLRAWAVLVVPAVRIGLRRVRRWERPRGRARSVHVVTAHGTVTFPLGARRPVLLDGRAVGELTTHDDAGTSTAETVVAWMSDSEESAVASVLAAVAEASFARGNHRAAVCACVEHSALLAALPRAGYQLEGAASPPHADTRAWTMWARLHTDAPVI